VIKFVIVEDEGIYKNTCKDIIEKIMFQNSLNYNIYYFDCFSSELKRMIDDKSIYKVFIMDIELKGKLSGIDIGDYIRHSARDWDSDIIFITSHDQMYRPAFDKVNKTFAFIEKFHDFKSRLEEDLKVIVSRDPNYQKYLFLNKRNNLRITLDDILYIYKDTSLRQVVIVTSHNKYETNTSLVIILKKLDNRFKQIHRACIVNTTKVQLYNFNEGYFILNNGLKVELCSKKYRDDKNV
jgi:DNA-binding LytR/AlgR family response regulator